MPAKKKRPVKVCRPVAKRSSQEASITEVAAEQDQQEEITFTSTSISTTHSHCCEEKEDVPGPIRRTRDGVGRLAKGESYVVHEDHEGIQRHGKEDTPLEFKASRA